MSSNSRKSNKRRTITSVSKRKIKKRRVVRRGTSPSHFLVSPAEEATFGPSFQLTVTGRLQMDQLFRAGSALYLRPRELQPGGGSVFVNSEYENTEYSSLDMLRSPLRVNCMDKWAAKEIALFEAGMCAWGKDFHCIGKHIGTKSTNECVEFYYNVWKHSQHYHIWKAHKKHCEELNQDDEVDLTAVKEEAPIPSWLDIAAGNLAPESKIYWRRLALVQSLRNAPSVPKDSPLLAFNQPAPKSTSISHVNTYLTEYQRVCHAMAIQTATHPQAKDINGSTTMGVYSSSNPYHLGIAKVNRIDDDKKGLVNFSPTLGRTQEASQSISNSWSDTGAASIETIKGLTNDEEKKDEKEKEKGRRKSTFVCEMEGCGEQFTNAQILYVHLRDTHFNQKLSN